MLRKDLVQRFPPLDVEVRHAQRLVLALEDGMEMLISLLLPLLSGRVAEEHSATEGPDGVNGAELAALKPTTAAVARRCSRKAGLVHLVQKRRQFQRRHVQAM